MELFWFWSLTGISYVQWNLAFTWELFFPQWSVNLRKLYAKHVFSFNTFVKYAARKSEFWHNVSEIMYVQVVRLYPIHYQLEKFQWNSIASGYIKSILRLDWILLNFDRKIKNTSFWYFKSNLNFSRRSGLKYFTIYENTLKSKFKWNIYLTFLNMKYLSRYKINPSEIFLWGGIFISRVATQLNLGLSKLLAKIKL